MKGVGFESWRSIGSVQSVINTHAARNVDELLIMNIGATPSGSGPDFDQLKRLTANCFMPVTAGGGISTLDHIRQALASGADKVAIGSAAIRFPRLIEAAAQRFGRQAIVVSIDFDESGFVVGACGTKPVVGLRCVEFAKQCAFLGAGELLLTSIPRDGSLGGLDLALLSEVSRNVSIPVVGAGGAGCVEHFADGLASGLHAVAAGAIWCWTSNTPAGIAKALHVAGFHTRLDFCGGHALGPVGDRVALGRDA